jgi:hypothetical protein
MTNINSDGILKRAKENWARAGLQWEPTASRVTGDKRRNAGGLNESARQAYLTEAYRQLLEEAAKNCNA